MSMVIRCPKCGAGKDEIQVEERIIRSGCFNDHILGPHHPHHGRMCLEWSDAESAGPVWVTCFACGYRTKSLSVKTWMQEVDA